MYDFTVGIPMLLEKYRKRVIQLGENPKNVFTVGGLGAKSISMTKILV